MAERPSPPLDGLSQPSDKKMKDKETAVAAVAKGNTSSPLREEKKRSAKIIGVALITAVTLYVFGGLVLLVMFPTTNVTIWWMRPLAMSFYSIGMFVWLAAGGFALYRVLIAKVKDMQIKLVAVMRTFALGMPAVGISVAVLLLINREPALLIDIVAPQGEMVAPVSVMFGTDVAQQVFRKLGLLPLRYSWDFDGNGEVDQVTGESQITAYYPRSGIYNVSAIAEMTDGSTRTLTRPLRITKEVFSVQPGNPVINEPATFSLTHLFDDPTEFTRAQWDLDGDGTTDVEGDSMSVTYTYHRLGEIKTKVTITYANNAVLTMGRSLTVVEAPKQPFPVAISTLPPTLLGTAPFGVLFSLETDEPVASVTWTFGDEGIAEGPIAQHVFNREGNFPVTAVVRSQAGTGTIARVTKLVQVAKPLELRDLRFMGTPEVRGFRIEGEQPLTVDVTPQTSQPLVTFTWDAPQADEIFSTDKTLHAIFRKVGVWDVELVGVGAEQKIFRRTIKVAVVPPESDVSIDVDPPTPVAPSLVQFDASNTFIPGKKITGFEWDFGDRTRKPLGAHAEHFYQEPGTYTVLLRVKTLDGYIFEERKVIVVRSQQIDACFVPSRFEVTLPSGGVRFDPSCSTEGFVAWEWDFGDNAQSEERSPIHVFTDPGQFLVTLKATDDEGKVSQQQMTIIVHPRL